MNIGRVYKSATLMAITLAAGCSGTASPSMFANDNAKKAVATIVKAMEDPNARILMLEITSEQVELHAENRREPGTVHNWWYFKGEVGGPKEVTLVGAGVMDANTIKLADVNFGAVSAIVTGVKKLWGFEKVASMKIEARRHVRSGGLRFYWTVDDGNGRFVDASLQGVLPLPQAHEITKHAKAEEWAKAFDLCDVSSYLRKPDVAAACDAIALPMLTGAKRKRPIRYVCERVGKRSKAYRSACDKLGYKG